jgi:hypothetical protein
MLDRARWTPLPMPQDVIDRVAVLARQIPVGMNFANMRNEAIYDLDDGDSDSDDDSDQDSDDDNDEDDDDNCDDFIAGVDAPNNADLPDPPDENENVDEHQQNDDEEHQQNDDKQEDDEGDDDGNEEQEQAKAEEPIEEPVTPASLKKLADATGASTSSNPGISDSKTDTKQQRDTCCRHC